MGHVKRPLMILEREIQWGKISKYELGQDFLVTPLTYGVEVITKEVMENRVGILPQGGGQGQRIIPHTAELKWTAWKFEGSNG